MRHVRVVASPGETVSKEPDRQTTRVCFFFNAHVHQMLHALPVAIALSRSSDIEVSVLAASRAHIDLARELAIRMAAGAIRFEQIGTGWAAAMMRATGASIPPKLMVLAAARRRLACFDAIVVPERTSLLLRKTGLKHVRFIHTCHGAGDRAVGFDPRIRDFDFVLLAGQKQRHRMLETGLIREDAHAIVGYPKFDAVAALPRWQPPFPEKRPTVLYNPHCSAELSSWHTMGEAIIRQFAEDARYNLIVAPHIKMFDGKRRRAEALRRLEPYARYPNIHIDPGSERSIDMSYTRVADAYIGDVSSQVYEFLQVPKPCVFLNAHGVLWRGDENYAHWRYGPVLETCEDVVDAVQSAFTLQPFYSDIQWIGIRETMNLNGELSSVRAARAIVRYLAGSSAAPTVPLHTADFAVNAPHV